MYDIGPDIESKWRPKFDIWTQICQDIEIVWFSGVWLSDPDCNAI
jgi:hypothetical protein